MNRERQLLKRWLIDFGKIHPDVELLKDTQALLAQPERESINLDKVDKDLEICGMSEDYRNGYSDGIVFAEIENWMRGII